jgi:hypothetical protein
MSSLRQIEANRGNAQKSTGPTSVTGKAVSSMNALAKTAIYAQSLLLPSENLADLEQLIDEWYRRHNPASPEARSLVDDLIYGEWIKRRLRAAETQIWVYDHQETYRPTKRTPSGQPPSAAAKPSPNYSDASRATAAPPARPCKNPHQLQAAAATETVPQPAVEPAGRPSPTPTPAATSPQIGFVPETARPDPPQPAPPALWRTFVRSGDPRLGRNVPPATTRLFR